MSLFSLFRRSRPPVAATPDLATLAHASVDDGYDGPPADEPNVRAMLARLQAEASRAFRTSADLRDAQARYQDAIRKLERQAHEEAEAPQSLSGGDPAQNARVARTHARQAAARRRSAEAALADVRREVEALEARVIDEVGIPVETGLAEPNNYLAEFNSYAAYKGRRCIGLLDVGETTRAIVSEAVRPYLTGD